MTDECQSCGKAEEADDRGLCWACGVGGVKL